jgi:hypothetical protein
MIDKKNKRNYFYINDDKVSESEKFKNIKEINLHPIFSRIVVDSIKKFPREYLFSLDVEHKEIKLLNILKEITEMDFTFSMARSSYINHWYKINKNASQNEIEKLCEEMRHSDEAHRDYYKKVAETDGNIYKHSLMVKFIEEDIKNNVFEEKKDIIVEKRDDGYSVSSDYSDCSDNSDIDMNDLNNLIKKELSEKYKKNAVYDLVYKANKRRETDEKYKIKDDTMKKYDILIGDDGKYYTKKKEKIKVIKEKKQLKEPLSQAQFNKRRADTIRFANKRIENGKDAFIKADTMLYYNIKYNNLSKKYE